MEPPLTPPFLGAVYGSGDDSGEAFDETDDESDDPEDDPWDCPVTPRTCEPSLIGRYVLGRGRWTVEVPAFASTLNALAVVLPIVTILTASWSCRVVADLALIPAIL